MRPSLRKGRRVARIGITPLVDVVFILMIFFMLASRFTVERQMDLHVAGTSGGGGAEIRMIVAGPSSLMLDGAALTSASLAAQLGERPEATVAIRPVDGATIQRLIAVADIARAAGVADISLAR